MATLGIGVIILIVIWVITIATLTLFTFSQSSIRYVGLLALVIAVIITLVLTLLPRGEVSRASTSDPPSNYSGVARILILTFLCVTFLVGLVLIFVHEILPPIYAQPVRKRFVR
ncbi:unnamed protein product [Rotaria sp. Silwood2]|nr:unnamed protein product [Rotaria sp. Silwood2]CAF2636573.1 unnamed protein product [Rotaria sp. Silwood2]CAF3053779.1 unnamed protein product [Rotaria sp. Silwood2]CAF4126553.1 unnamed protein product [Rotaria sp. Silwood2]CAF4176454.1 unnamed protein product [Rotaria sp. Silwood2]